MKKLERTPLPQYSYKQNTKREDIKLLKRIGLIALAFFVVVLIIWFATTTFLAAIANLSVGNQDETPLPKTNTLPLLAPKLDRLPKATNVREITINGQTTSQVQVTLVVNGKKIETVKAATTGNFSFEDVTLKIGLNSIKVTASDGQAEKSTSETITVDRTKPALTVTKPESGQRFSEGTKTVNVTGATEKNAFVYVNNSQAVVDANGGFSINISVKKGTNAIKLKAVDEAGNSTELEISVVVD